MSKGEVKSKSVRCCHPVLALMAVVSVTTASVTGGRPPQLNGFKAIRVHYSPLNKMIMSVRINGQPANLLVDTGSNEIILDAAEADSFGIKPSQGNLRYIQSTRVNGQQLPVAFAQNLSAGTVSFGSHFVALRDSKRPVAGDSNVDGVLGLNFFTRYKAIINCRAKLIFFRVDRAPNIDLRPVASEEKFTAIPLREERNGALTVPCSIRGEATRLLVDTGSFITILHEPLLKSLGVSVQATHISVGFTRGASRKINAGRIDDLKIGHFKDQPGKFGVIALPNFTLVQGDTKIGGILGMDTLYKHHALIDLGGMNLFLK
jgi:predicted aspartyl protease